MSLRKPKSVHPASERKSMQQVETFKHHGEVCTSDRMRNKEFGSRIVNANAGLRELYRSVVTKHGLSTRAPTWGSAAPGRVKRCRPPTPPAVSSFHQKCHPGALPPFVGALLSTLQRCQFLRVCIPIFTYGHESWVMPDKCYLKYKRQIDRDYWCKH